MAADGSEKFNLYQRFVRRFWWLILLLCAGAAVGAGLLLPDVSVEAGTDVLLNEDDDDLAYYNQTRADWSYDEYLIVCCHRNDGWFTPEAVKLLNSVIAELKKIPHVSKITAITTVPLLRNRKMSFLELMNPQFPHLTDPKIDMEKARDELTHHTQALGNLISENGQDASVLVYLDVNSDMRETEPIRNRLLGRPHDPEAKKQLKEIDPKYRQAKVELDRRRNMLVQKVRLLAEAWKGKFDEPVRLSGLSFINVLLKDHIQSDIRNFGVLSFLLFTLTYFIIYRRVRWVAIPVVACLLPVVFMLALMVMTGKKVTVVTSNMPVLLFVLMLPYSVYFIERYCERRSNNPEESHIYTTTKSPLEMWAPCLYSCLATMAGTAAHMPSGINPVRTFGLMMTIGMGIGLTIIMLFLPSTNVPLKSLNVSGWGVSAGPRGPLKLLNAMVLRAPLAVVLFSLAVLGLSIWGTTRITVETKFINYFWSRSPIHQGLDYIDNRMGGTTPLEVILTSQNPGYFKTQAGLAALDSVARFFDKNRVPERGNVRSFKTLIDEVRKMEIAGGMKEEKIVPILLKAAPDQVEEFCNKDFSISRVMIRMKETAPTLNRNRILKELRSYLASRKDIELKDVEARPTGIFLLYSNMLNTLIKATRDTFVLAVLSIFLMLWVLFRSPLLALIVLLPQVLPVFLVLGTMGFTGIALDMVTVVIASVAMGVGIDAAIQYTVRFKKELEAVGGDIEKAVTRSHATIGRAIFIATSIVFAGFIILMLSNFVPTFYFGLFTGLAIIMGLFASLTTLPSMFVLLRYPRLKK